MIEHVNIRLVYEIGVQTVYTGEAGQVVFYIIRVSDNLLDTCSPGPLQSGYRCVL